MRALTLIITLLIIASAVCPCAAVVYVKYDSPGPALDGDTWGTAYRTIQTGLNDASATGEEVRVARGVYVEKLTISSPTVLLGGFAGEGDIRDPGVYVTTIDARDSTVNVNAVTFTSPATVDGFTVTGAYSGFFASGCSPTISNNVVRGNRKAGVRLTSSSANVTDNVIEDSSDGITCWSPGSAVISGNTIRRVSRGVNCVYSSAPSIVGNFISDSSDAAVYCQNSSPAIRNNRIWQNRLFGVCCEGGSLAIVANTILGCGSSGVYCTSSSPLVANNVIAGCASIGVLCQQGSSPLITNNTMSGNLGGVACYGASPVVQNCILIFNYWGVRYAGGSLTLKSNCVYGNGPLDYVSTVPGEGDISADPLFVSQDTGDFHIRPDSPCRNAGIAVDNPALAYDIDGQPRPQGAAVDIGADESYGESPLVAPRVVYVNGVAPAGGDGSSWANAYDSIQSGVEDVLPRGPAEIWVAAGTYPEQVLLRPFAHIYGGFAGDESNRTECNWRQRPTVIDISYATGETTGVFGANISTVDGFTIRGAYRGVYCYYSAPRVANNTLTGNVYAGLSVYNGFPTGHGNIMSANSNGAVFVASHGLLTNNTIADNDIGVACFNSGPFVGNNIAAFNNIGVYIGSSSPWLEGNNVFGSAGMDYSPDWYPHETDISADPLFADAPNGDYHILPGSPCIDAGWNEALGMPPVDMDGQGRICWGLVDIGADELWPIRVKIDIRPGESPNHINPGSRGLVPVALLSSRDFDAMSADPATITLAGAPVEKRGNKFFCDKTDANRDGLPDLLLRFDSGAMSLPRGSASATLTGRDSRGWPIEGSDSVVVLGR